MRKEYGKVKGFRIDKEDEKLLNECFDMLHITDNSFNAKMPKLINAIHKQLQEKKDYKEKLEQKEKELEELKAKIPTSPSREEMEDLFKKFEVPKVEAVTPTQKVKKRKVTKEEPKPIEKPKPLHESVKLSSDGRVVLCKGPFYDQWVNPKICGNCNDAECEIKKGTVAFTKQKNELPLKRW